MEVREATPTADALLRDVRQGVEEIRTFARGVHQDEAAIRAAFSPGASDLLYRRGAASGEGFWRRVPPLSSESAPLARAARRQVGTGASSPVRSCP